FDEEPVERIRSQLLVGLARDAEDPDHIAGRVLRRLLFGNHPYSREVSGTPESIAKIAVADLRSFVAERFGRDNLLVGVVGDITPAELAPLLDDTFGGLPENSAPHDLPEADVSTEGAVVVIEKPIPQSIAVLGQPGIMRDDPDYYTAYVANHIFGGGGFTSRLYQKVREERGLAYSVYSYLSPLDYGAVLGAGVATQNARIGESIELIRDEWARFAAEGPTEKELDDAKTHLTGAFPLRLSSTGAISSLLVGMQLEELGIDYIDRRNDFIEAVTLEDARRVAGSLFQPDALSIVVVGQPEGVTATRPPPEGAS
ncbi:MAG: M16 family metallopeptidase, partial [Kiloniellales bacterium]